MQLLKDQFYNPAFYRKLSRQLSVIYPDMNANRFYQDCIKELDNLELKQRMTRTSEVCRKFLPDNYASALKVLYEFADTLEDNKFSYMFMPDFVARYGRHDFKRSIQALKDFTQYCSSELAIRVFLQDDFERALKIIKKWTQDDNVHVRRLSSEGTRPRLPWAVRISQLIENPQHCFPILEDLQQDKEKYVQKSVANHLNDISKDHPQMMLKLVKNWNYTISPTDWIVRHGSRTLIKQGNKQALGFFGADKKPNIRLQQCKLSKRKLILGDDLQFHVTLTSLATTTQKLVIDYKIHYLKASGSKTPKVFKLKNIKLKTGETVEISKKHAFKDFTTRKHYSGEHQLELVINGTSMKTINFHLKIQ